MRDNMKLDEILVLCDIDGVLADFMGEFQLYMRLAYGATLPLAHLTTFDLDRCIEGFLEDDPPTTAGAFLARFSTEHVLQQIFKNPYFYWHLRPYFEVKDALALHAGSTVFITNRDPALSHVNRLWMRLWDVRGSPFKGLKVAYRGEPFARGVDETMGVVYTHYKDQFIAETLKAYPNLRLVYLEDSPKNVISVVTALEERQLSHRARVIIVDQLYNREPMHPFILRMTREQILDRFSTERRLYDAGKPTTF